MSELILTEPTDSTLDTVTVQMVDVCENKFIVSSTGLGAAYEELVRRCLERGASRLCDGHYSADGYPLLASKAGSDAYFYGLQGETVIKVWILAIELETAVVIDERRRHFSYRHDKLFKKEEEALAFLNQEKE